MSNFLFLRNVDWPRASFDVRTVAGGDDSRRRRPEMRSERLWNAKFYVRCTVFFTARLQQKSPQIAGFASHATAAIRNDTTRDFGITLTAR